MDATATESLAEKVAGDPERRERLRARLRAFLIHFSISVAIFVVLMYLIIAHWYAGPYFRFDGGWRGTLIVIGVDLVLGPTLTLIIFDPRKAAWKIKLDLAFICLIQAAALAWGFYAVESQRPVALSFFNAGFHPITAQVIRGQDKNIEDLEQFHPQFPPLVFVEFPTDEAGRERMQNIWVEKGYSPHNQFQLLRPLKPHLEQIARQQPPVERMAKVNKEFRAELDAFEEQHGGSGEQFIYLPFNGRYGVVLFALDSEGRLVDYLTTAYKGIL
ncbi:MAG: hypothetical protein R3174_01475 [Gammaproteobacteria bacterium]|nr:hypothetical protein [Gammaproteobacteria bacterium]